jgi:hypothetical protein
MGDGACLSERGLGMDMTGLRDSSRVGFALVSSGIQDSSTRSKGR